MEKNEIKEIIEAVKTVGNEKREFTKADVMSELKSFSSKVDYGSVNMAIDGWVEEGLIRNNIVSYTLL